MSVFSCSRWLPKAAFMGSFPSPPLQCLFPSICSSGRAPPLWRRWLCTHIRLPPAQSPEPWAHLPLGPVYPGDPQAPRLQHGQPTPLPVFLASENGITTTPAHELELGVICRPVILTPPSHPHMQLVINSVDVISRKAPWHTLPPAPMGNIRRQDLGTFWFQQLLLWEASLPPHSPPPILHPAMVRRTFLNPGCAHSCSPNGSLILSDDGWHLQAA